MTVILILFVVLLLSLWVHNNSNRKHEFPTKKGVWHYQKGDGPWEEGKRVAGPETLGREVYAIEVYTTTRLNGIIYHVPMKHTSGRLRKQFIDACWKLHVELNPEKHMKRSQMSLRLRRRMRDGRGWRSAVLDPANNRGQFTNNK